MFWSWLASGVQQLFPPSALTALVTSISAAGVIGGPSSWCYPSGPAHCLSSLCLDSVLAGHTDPPKFPGLNCCVCVCVCLCVREGVWVKERYSHLFEALSFHLEFWEDFPCRNLWFSLSFSFPAEVNCSHFMSHPARTRELTNSLFSQVPLSSTRKPGLSRLLSFF